ncbi:MAG: hypothetical protein AB1586_31935 [Pseudomonadota bacterium]
MRRLILAGSAVATATAAWAAEPSGCDKFKWPIDRERAILRAEPLKVLSGATATPAAAQPVRIALRPTAEANLPTPPERGPKSVETFAGYVTLPAPPAAGTYAISLSAGAWLDAVQDGKPLKTVAFSGATDCEGIRKVVTFALKAEPLMVQISGVAADTITLAVTAAP